MNSINNDYEINEYIRKNINKSYEFNGVFHKISSDYFNKLVDSYKEKDLTDKIICSAISSIIYLDTYKIIANKVKKGIADETEMITFNDLASISSFEELKNYYEQDISRLLFGFERVNDFINLPALTKINMIKGLSKEENARLNSVTSLHQNDIDKYSIKVDKDYIYNFYGKYSRYIKSKSNKDNMESIVLLISNFIKENYFIEPSETKELINSISEDVFGHINDLKKILPSDIYLYDTLALEYQNETNNFHNICLLNPDIMELILGTYFLMKDMNIIKGKTYDKK